MLKEMNKINKPLQKSNVERTDVRQCWVNIFIDKMVLITICVGILLINVSEPVNHAFF